MEKIFSKYDKLRDEIFEYFGYESWDLGVQFQLEDKWDYDGNSVCWFDEDFYSEEVRKEYKGVDYTLFVVYSSFGGEGISIFKNSNREIGLEE